MIVNGQQWSDCDMCGEKKRSEYGYLAQGATGRWCVVLSSCKDCLPADATILTPEEATAECIKRGGSPDF